MNSFADVIDALGIAALSELLGIADSHVRTMKARDSIPPGYFKRIVDSELGETHGIGFELLHRLLEEVREREARADKRTNPDPERPAA